MEFKGTKTQWLRSENSIGFVYALNYGNTNAFSLNINNDGKLSDEEIKANAQLISSAPELLESLKDVMKSFVCFRDEDLTEESLMIKNKAIKAIEKATKID